MKHLILILGLLLLAVPAQAQVTTFFARYVADGSAPGAIPALANGDLLCPPHSSDCRGYSQAHHHILGTTVAGTPSYSTDVLDVHNCTFITVSLDIGADNDGTTAELYVESVLDDTGAGGAFILPDFNGDGTVNASDYVPLDGDQGNDNDGDNTARQTYAIYDITGKNKIRLSVYQGGGAAEEGYAEVSCR